MKRNEKGRWFVTVKKRSRLQPNLKPRNFPSAVDVQLLVSVTPGERTNTNSHLPGVVQVTQSMHKEKKQDKQLNISTSATSPTATHPHPPPPMRGRTTRRTT